MSVENEVLRQLMQRSHWEEYGELIHASSMPTRAHTTILNIIREYHTKNLGLPDKPDLSVREIRLLLTERSAPGHGDEDSAVADVLETLEVKHKSKDAKGETPPGVLAALVRDFRRRSAVRQLGAHVFNLEELDGDAFEMRWGQLQAAAQQLVAVDEEIEASTVEPVKLSDLTSLAWEYGPRVKLGFSKILDDAMGGGLPIGWIGEIIAPTHVGKTVGLKNIGACGIKEGRNVAHVTLETPGGVLLQDYYSLLTGIPVKEIQDRQEEAIALYDKEGWGELYLYDMRGRGCSVHTLGRLVRKLVSEVPISLLLVDYLELLDKPGDQSTHLELARDMRMLQRLGTNHHFAVWTAAQANRFAKMEGTTREHHVQGSYQLTQIADVNLLFSQNEEEKAMGTLRCEISKNRPGGKTFRTELKIDWATLAVRDVEL